MLKCGVFLKVAMSWKCKSNCWPVRSFEKVYFR